MRTLVICLEEPSAKAMLEGVLPRILPEGVTVRYIVFEGKQDMHKQLVRRLRLWQQPESRFVVMRDQDGGDCHHIKQQLQELCNQAGKEDVLIRIACRELESFYLEDLAAVELALQIPGLGNQQNKAKFRNPDELAAAAEHLHRITEGEYQKMMGSRAIGPHMSTQGENRSTSFNALLNGIRRLYPEIETCP